ncbi:MAG: TlpA disulfide reductase family protein [Planctomycetota bacterium]
MSVRDLLLSFTTVAALVLFASTAPAQEQPAEKPGVSIPDGTVEELFEYVDTVARRQPEGDDEQAIVRHNLETARSILAISEAVLAKEPSDRDAAQAVSLQLQALTVLRRLEEPGADKVFDKAVDAARRDDRADVRAFGLKYFIESGFERWSITSDDQKQAVVDAVAGEFEQDEVGGSEVQLLMTVTDFLADVGEEQRASGLFEQVMPRLRETLDAEMVGRIEGVARRIGLLGNEMELEGTLLGGGELDWKSYRGKVVLVDFWASWCGPCRAEVPNVLRMYQAYREKGFDVVGINLDATEEQANSYIVQMELPWPNLFNQDEAAREWEHPMVVYYGVTGIPRAILVDREGKVVSMNARGPELERLLREQLGAPVASAETPDGATTGGVSPAGFSQP